MKFLPFNALLTFIRKCSINKFVLSGSLLCTVNFYIVNSIHHFKLFELHLIHTLKINSRLIYKQISMKHLIKNHLGDPAHYGCPFTHFGLCECLAVCIEPKLEQNKVVELNSSGSHLPMPLRNVLCKQDGKYSFDSVSICKAGQCPC